MPAAGTTTAYSWEIALPRAMPIITLSARRPMWASTLPTPGAFLTCTVCLGIDGGWLGAPCASGAQTDPFNAGATARALLVRVGGGNTGLRSAHRTPVNPGDRFNSLGFRVGFQQVPDTVSPELELFGGTEVPHELGEPWAEPGYGASDERDGI